MMTSRSAKAAGPARAARQGTRLSPRRSPEHKLTYALLLSLLIHTLLLHLTFGYHGWLPGFRFPWQDRPIAIPDLRVSLVPAWSTPAEPTNLALLAIGLIVLAVARRRRN